MRVRGPNRRTVLLGTAAAVVAATAGCGRDDTTDLPELLIATGPPGAVFREIGSEIASVLAERLPDTDVHIVETGASPENLRLLRAGEVQLGLSSMDSMLATGVNDDDGLTAVCRLYDSFLHLVVLAESPVERLPDLEGLRVSMGADNSGTEFTSERIVAETGLSMDAVRMNQAVSAEALGSGEIDAMFSLTGLPTPAIASLAKRRSLRLVDLSETANTLAGSYPGSYFPATIPATTYEGVSAAPTMSIPNLLLCREDLPHDLAYLVTDTVFTRAARLAAARPEAVQINVRTGISTGIVPLHPGAVEWYRDRKPV